jgi:hypothetical protein
MQVMVNFLALVKKKCAALSFLTSDVNYLYVNREYSCLLSLFVQGFIKQFPDETFARCTDMWTVE